MRRLLFALALLLPGLAAAQVCGPRIGKLPSFTVVTRPTAATPTFSPAAGTYLPGQEVTISTTSGDGLIRLTTDGNDPTGAPPGCGLRSCKVTLSTSQTIKAITSQSGTTSSAVASAAYTLSGPGTGPSYFVDSVNGTDTGSNPCTSQATPCRSIARVLAVSPPVNSTIYLARGSRWREQLSGLASGVSVRAYGTDLRPAVDNRPMLDASDVAANASFTKTAGRTSVYEIPWQVPVGSAGDRHGVWENGVRLPRVADVATVDSTACSYYAPLPPTGGTDTVYVHACDNSAVTSNGRVYELRKRTTGVEASVGGSLVSLRARRQVGSGGSILSYTYGKDLLAEDGGTHNLWFEGTCEDCVAAYNEPPPNYGGSTLFVTFPSGKGAGGGASRAGGTCRRCQAIGVGDAKTIGFYSHTVGGADVWARVVYESCSAKLVVTGFSGSNVTSIVLRNPTTTQTTYGVQISDGTVTNLYVLGGLFDGTTAPLLTCSVSSGVTNTVIRGVRTVQVTNSNLGVFSLQGTSAEVRNSTFAWSNPSGFYFMPVYRTAGASLVFRNNIVSGSNHAFQVTAGTLDAEANDYYGTMDFQTTSTWANFAAYRAANPALDATSITTSPSYTGSLATGDTSISSSSGAYTLGAGADAPGVDAAVEAYYQGILAQ